MRTRLAQTITVLLTGAVFAVSALAQEASPPKIDHILLQVADLKKSIAFYHDLLGLKIKSQNKGFATLESANVGVFLSSGHLDWDEKRPMNVRPGWGMYPHFEVADVAATVEARAQSRIQNYSGAAEI